LLVLPLRVLGRQRLHPVEGEGKLEIDRLLSPQRAVVIKRGDAFQLGYKVLAARRSDALHEVHNGAFGGAISPRRQRIVRRCSAVYGYQRKNDHKQCRGESTSWCVHEISAVLATRILFLELAIVEVYPTRRRALYRTFGLHR